MTTKDPPDRLPSAAQNTEAFNRFHGIFRAGGGVAASGRKHRRDDPLVCSQKAQYRALGEMAHDLSAFGSGRSAFGILSISSGRTRRPELPFYDYESLAHFVQHGVEAGG